MIRSLRAFVWLRWRLFVNAVRGGRRRDALERASRTLAVVVPVGLFLVVLASAAGLSILSFAGGKRIGLGAMKPDAVLFTFRLVLLIALAFMVLLPMGGTTREGYTRLLLLPIPRRALHLIEVLAGAASPWIVVLLPVLALFSAGLALAGRWDAAAAALAAALGMTAVLVALGALASFVMSWLMRNRRRGELFTLVSVLLLSLAGLLPMLAGDRLERRARAEKGSVLEHIDQALPVWSRAIPSELYGRSVDAGLEGRSGAAWLGALVLFAEAAVLFALSSAMHRKLLGTVESGGGRRRTDPLRAGGLRLPGLTPAASAVAIAQFRTGVRSVRGRLIVLMPGPLLAVLGLVSARVPGEFPGGSFLGSQGHLLLGGGIVFSLYALQAFTMNQFASDRSGLTLQLLAPIREVDLVRGKAVGCALILSVAVLICLVCSLLAAPIGSPLAWLSVLLGGAATYMLLTPVAVLFSALLPRAADLSKTGSGGNPHGLAFLVGTLLVLVLSGLPGLILALLDRRPGLTLLLMLAWTLLAAAVSIPFLTAAAGAVTPRRENLALVAQGR